MRYPDARDRVRLVAGRVRDGLHVLRDRPGRVRAPPRPSARSSSRCCAPRTRRPQRVSNVVFMGMGEPLANYDSDVGARSSASTTTSASRPAASPSAPSASCPAMRRLAAERAPGHAGGLAARRPTTNCAATLVPLNRRYPIAEVLDAAADVRRRQGPPGHLRVRLHRGRERLARTRPRRSAALLGAFPGVGGAHVNLIPLNPTDGFGGHAPAGAVAPGLRRPAPSPRGDRDGAAQPGHRHRRRLRAAALRGRRSPAGPPPSATMEP